MTTSPANVYKCIGATSVGAMTTSPANVYKYIGATSVGNGDLDAPYNSLDKYPNGVYNKNTPTGYKEKNMGYDNKQDDMKMT